MSAKKAVSMCFSAETADRSLGTETDVLLSICDM